MRDMVSYIIREAKGAVTYEICLAILYEKQKEWLRERCG
jgi:hypothetical protein